MGNIPHHIVAYYARKRTVPLADAELLFARLEAFLADAAAEHASPELDVDDAWHEFILHTRDYAEFCERQFGRMIHHVPDLEFDFENAGSQSRGNKCSKCSSPCRRAL